LKVLVEEERPQSIVLGNHDIGDRNQAGQMLAHAPEMGKGNLRG
jgi:hypothetical protein